MTAKCVLEVGVTAKDKPDSIRSMVLCQSWNLEEVLPQVPPWIHLFHLKVKVKVKVRIALYTLETRHRATERHLPYGITRCYLLPNISKRAPP